MTSNDQLVDDRLLSSLAMLHARWDQNTSGYVENFVPFALEAITRNPATDYSAEDVRDRIATEFGLRLPVAIVKTVLRRAVGQHLGTRTDAGQFIPRPVSREDRLLVEEQQAFLRQQSSLVTALATYAEKNFAVELTSEGASVALFSYVDRHASKLLSAAARGEENPVWETLTPTDLDPIVGAFIKHIYAQVPDSFDYLVRVVKGSILVSSVYLPGATTSPEDFKETELVIDTPVLLSAMGFVGEESESAAVEMLRLSSAQGAVLVTYLHIIRETKGVLDGAATRLRNVGSKESYRAVEAHFIERGMASSDILLAIESVDSKLETLGIKVVPVPDRRDYSLGIDEPALAELLEAEVRYSRPWAGGLQRDLDSLTAVYRARRRREGDRLETCRAVLVTNNRSLVRVAKTFPDFERQGWPLAMHADQVTTIVWLKQPMTAPDLPKHQILADCLTVLAPRPTLWAAFMDRVDRLLIDGKVDETQVILLRSSLEARTALLEEKAGLTDEVSETDVQSILAKVENAYKAPLQAELAAAHEDIESARDALRAAKDAEAQAVATAESEKSEALDRLSTQSATISRRLGSFSRVVGELVRWTLTVALVAILVAAVFATGPLDDPTRPQVWVRIVAGVVLAVLAVTGGFMGMGRAVRNAVARAVSALAHRAVGLERSNNLEP